MLKIYLFLLSFSVFLASQTQAFTFINPFKPGKARITIEGRKRLLTRSTSCKVKKWGYNQRSSCICCVVKQGIRRKGFKYSGKYISYCLKKKHCTLPILQTLAQDHGLIYDETNPGPLVKSIIDKARGIQIDRLKPPAHSHSKHVSFKPSLTQKPSTPPSSAIRHRKKAENLLKHRLARQKKYLSAIKKPTIDEVVIDTGIETSKLTSSILKPWLEKSGLLNKKLFANPSCLTITKSRFGGSFTESLFFVHYHPSCDPAQPKKLIFIIKELKRNSAEKEIRNLNILQNSPVIRSLGRAKDPNLPQMTFSENFFQYKTLSGEKKYLLLIHAAKGKSFIDLMSNSEDQTNIAAFKKLGVVLANFNKKFMGGKNCKLTGGTDLKACTAISHGDMHPVNIFYDGKFIYFIDTETMVESLKKRTPFATDALYFYTMPVYYWKLDIASFKNLYRFFERSYLNNLTSSAETRVNITTQLMDPTMRSLVNGLRFITSEVRRLRS